MQLVIEGNVLLKAMQLVIESNVKTSVITYIHATTYIHVKPAFTQALMIWLVNSNFIS